MVDLVYGLVLAQSLLKTFSGLPQCLLLVLLALAFEEAEAFPEVVVLALEFEEEVAHEAEQGQVFIYVVLASDLVKHLEKVSYLSWVGESFGP